MTTDKPKDAAGAPICSKALLDDYGLLKQAALMFCESEPNGEQEEKSRNALECLCGWREPDNEDLMNIEYVRYWMNHTSNVTEHRADAAEATVPPVVGEKVTP